MKLRVKNEYDFTASSPLFCRREILFWGRIDRAVVGEIQFSSEWNLESAKYGEAVHLPLFYIYRSVCTLLFRSP